MAWQRKYAPLFLVAFVGFYTVYFWKWKLSQEIDRIAQANATKFGFINVIHHQRKLISKINQELEKTQSELDQSEEEEEKTRQDGAKVHQHVEKSNRQIIVAERLSNARAACQVWAGKPVDTPWYREQIYDRTHHLLYCKIPKAASSTMLSYIYELNGKDISKFAKKGLVHDNVFQYFPKLTTKADFRAALDSNLVFTIIRHPFQRALSAYLDRVVRVKYFSAEDVHVMLRYRNKNTTYVIQKEFPMYSRDMSNEKGTEGSKLHKLNNLIHGMSCKERHSARKNATTEPLGSESKSSVFFNHRKIGIYLPIPTFREFVLFVSVKILKCLGKIDCLNNIDRHLLPESVICNPCALPFDMIMKVETLGPDFAHLRKILNLPELRKQVQEHVAKLDGRKEDVIAAVGNNVNTLTNADLTANYTEIVANAGPKYGLSYSDYMNQLSALEKDILFTAYYKDFHVFGYDPCQEFDT